MFALVFIEGQSSHIKPEHTHPFITEQTIRLFELVWYLKRRGWAVVRFVLLVLHDVIVVERVFPTTTIISHERPTNDKGLREDKCSQLVGQVAGKTDDEADH